MSYEKINFKNREVEKPLTFKKHVNDDGTITLEPKPGTIVEEGTPLLADHFNHMDDGIYKAHEEIDNLKLSGIERNKELVANLNSKKVSATTNDSLKTNIAKVKDIKLGSGNAVASDVLEGKTFSSSSGTDLTGTMPNNGVLSKTITTQGGTQKINKGYYEGGEIKAQFNNLTPSNIRDGVNVGGIVGSFTKGMSQRVNTYLDASESKTTTKVLFKDIPSHAKAIIFEGTIKSDARAGYWGIAFGKNNSDSEYRIIVKHDDDLRKWGVWLNSICTIHDNLGHVQQDAIRYSHNPVSPYSGNNAFIFYHYGSSYGGGTAYINGTVTVLW